MAADTDTDGGPGAGTGTGTRTGTDTRTGTGGAGVAPATADGGLGAVLGAGGGPAGPRGAKRARRSRRGRLALALVVLIAGGAAAAAALGLGRAQDDTAGAPALPPKTAEVDRRDLKDSKSTDGSLGFGTSRTAISRIGGTLTGVAEAGDTVGRGKALYEVDDVPVTLMYGPTPAYRALKSGLEGDDVRQLERNLAALGYSGFTVDEEFTDLTADAVKEWQEDLGVKETGTVDLGRVVFVPGEVRVDSVEAEQGAALAPGGKVLAYTGTGKAVTVELEPADQDMAKEGTKVEVVLPDDTVAKGVVEDVTTVITPGGNGEDDEAETTVEVVIGLTDAKGRKAADSYALAAVDVEFTAGTREDVLTVPVSALLALSEGGFGVEVVEGTATRYAPVEPGLFADGRVEITGDGITEGTKVGVPE
ncbi:peptidoglycan-binding domain-containing protein [Streptomyces uncialis]|uniref:peptidoglycan-binding domain-containing protein n=1 Tax=Streptomyces uncialis TaxID=1048205 RepID=UPI0022521D19|nr:peptidoglycan-binding domain-containing protein [Streptomyces uncialis]MCX4664568.1 peptidoglycan-binding protein [Streptomyces uncialis]